MTYRIRELHLFLRAVLGRKQVSHREEEQEQLDRAADRVILVTRLDVADSDGGAGYAVELLIGVGEETHSGILHLIKIHSLRQCCETGVVVVVTFWGMRRCAEVPGTSALPRVPPSQFHHDRCDV
jgi:hypothetical protein